MEHKVKTPLLEFRNVEKRFSRNVVLSNLSFSIYNSEIVALIGKSGCGKSTLIKILLGLYPPQKGEIKYNNLNLLNNYSKMKEIVGFVSQDNSFYEKLTVLENLKFFGKLYGVKKKDIGHRIPHLLSLVKLESSKNVLAEKLSGGMKRRLEFAISLIHDPHILILDEPFAGLDAQIKKELWKVLKQIKESHVTILVVTHLLSSAQLNADRVLVLNNKKIQKEIDLNVAYHKNPHFDLEKEFLDEVSL